MALVSMRDMLYHAYENHYAVGAFDLISLDFLEAVISAAERCRAPVVLSVAEHHFAHYDIELMMPAVEAAAKRASVPVAIQLDHGRSLTSASKAINLGCNGVMLDASHQELPDNIVSTTSVVEMAHSCGIPVIGELGYIAGKEHHDVDTSALNEGELTVPAEAKAYVQRTGVDFLAISIGTVQGGSKEHLKLDFPRLKQINDTLKIPLVIHGGSSLDEEQLRRLTAKGVSMINYYTKLSEVAAQSMRHQLKDLHPNSFISVKKGVKAAIGEDAERCMRLFGSAGRAAEVLTQCEAWRPVEQLIIYNIERLTAPQASAMVEEGRRILKQTPGIRDVFAGETLKEGSKYRFCWVVQFVHPMAITGCRTYPEYLGFIDNMFRPYSHDRISLNFQEQQHPQSKSSTAKTHLSSPLTNTLV